MFSFYSFPHVAYLSDETELIFDLSVKRKTSASSSPLGASWEAEIDMTDKKQTDRNIHINVSLQMTVGWKKLLVIDPYNN